MTISTLLLHVIFILGMDRVITNVSGQSKRDLTVKSNNGTKSISKERVESRHYISAIYM